MDKSPRAYLCKFNYKLITDLPTPPVILPQKSKKAALKQLLISNESKSQSHIALHRPHEAHILVLAR